MLDTTPDDAIAAWLTTPEQAARTSPTPDLAELRRLAEAATAAETRVAELTAERDALAIENARLREGVR